MTEHRQPIDAAARRIRPIAPLARRRSDELRRRSAAGRRRRWSRSAHPTPRSVMLRLDVADRVDHLPGPALRDPADGRRRLRRPTVLLDRLAAVGSADRAVDRAARRRRGVRVPGRRRRAGRRTRGSRPDRRLVRLGRHDARPSGWPAAAARCRWWRWLRHAAVLGRPELLKLAVSARHACRTCRTPSELAAAGALIALSRTDQPTRPAGRLTAAELRPLVVDGRDHVRLRLGRLRRVRQQPAGRAGLSGGGCPGGAVRAERLSLPG